MRRPWALFLVSAIAGCTCRKSEQPTEPAVVADVGAPTLVHDLELRRNVLMAFGNATPLPVSEEFTEEAAQLGPPLERATSQRPNQPLRLRVAREVPYGQLTRLMQAAMHYRVLDWELQVEDVTGVVRVANVKAPSPTPRGDCWARAWVGPDARVVVGVDLGGDAATTGLTGILVVAKEERAQGNLVVEAVRRADPHCAKGQLRVYSQPTARVGPAFDVALAFSTAPVRPHISELVFAVPSVGALDSTVEVVK